MTKKKAPASQKKPITKRPWFWAVIGIVVVCAVIGSGDEENNQQIAEDELKESIVHTAPADRSMPSDTLTQQEYKTELPQESFDSIQSQEPSPVPDQSTPNPTLQGIASWDPDTQERTNWPQGKFLASAKSGEKYHSGNCIGSKRILPENELWFDSEEQAQAAGYSRCGSCW